eukprot:s76_g28.t1
MGDGAGEVLRGRRPLDDLTGRPAGGSPRGVRVPLLSQLDSCQLRGSGNQLDEFEEHGSPAGKTAGEAAVKVREEGSGQKWEIGHHDASTKLGGDQPCRTELPEDRDLEFAGKTFAELGGSLNGTLQQLIWTRHGKILTKAADNIYPLPLGAYPGIHPSGRFKGKILEEPSKSYDETGQLLLPTIKQVTASDASSSGGGISCSTGLTDFGVAAQAALVRGEMPEPLEQVEVLTVGLFDGIGALRVAADVLHLPMAGHISVECNSHANRVLESSFPGSRHVGSVQDVTEEEVTLWACEYSSVGVVLLGAGPPCQGVSQLNVDRKGSQKDARSSLYKEIPRIDRLVRRKFPWAQVHTFVESVASMDAKDRAAMSEDLNLLPNKVDAVGVSLARRPRLYWCTWELVAEEGMNLLPPEGSGWYELREIELQATVEQKLYLQPGWFVPPGHRLATFTTSRPSHVPGRRPAGLHACDEAALARWREDMHRYPPYQYKAEYGVHHGSGQVRVASILEREVILGFPANYTEQCVSKADRATEWASDVRKTLLGNSWAVPVVVCLLKQLFERLGIIQKVPIQTLVDRMAPGNGLALQAVLQRPPIHRETAQVHPEDGLARRLSGLVSIKGSPSPTSDLRTAGEVPTTAH